ncbi:universal stress protein [Pseudonocardia pini]|uniref:universal stress protein n=1 Tax=Pseudonocardia pini TaxID=2758030 RepID=UPI0015F0FB10|nr:universal stress protein [Pseudonocardia pini]
MSFEYGVDGPRAIVVGIDGSETAYRALHYAVGQARRQGGRVVAVYADRIPSLAFATAVPLAATAVVDPATDTLLEELRTAVEQLGTEYGVPSAFEMITGDPVNALVRVAERERADAILVGASVQAGHKLFGSVAMRVVKTGRWPVTVVP